MNASTISPMWFHRFLLAKGGWAWEDPRAMPRLGLGGWVHGGVWACAGANARVQSTGEMGRVGVPGMSGIAARLTCSARVAGLAGQHFVAG